MNYNYEVVLWMFGRGGLSQENVEQALQIVSILETPQEIVDKLLILSGIQISEDFWLLEQNNLLFFVCFVFQ